MYYMDSIFISINLLPQSDHLWQIEREMSNAEYAAQVKILHVNFIFCYTSGPLFTKQWDVLLPNQGLYSLSGETSYCQISRSLEATRLDVIMIVSLLKLAGLSESVLSRCQSNFRAIGKVETRIPRLRDLAKFCSKTSAILVNRGQGYCHKSS